jgi:hypothetical protein
MAFRQMLVLLSGRLSSSTAFPACFSSAFSQINQDLLSTLLSGNAFRCFNTELNTEIWLDFNCTVLLLWVTSRAAAYVFGDKYGYV